MRKTTVKVNGMSCPMCESHINDCIRNRFTVKKVTSSHKKGETVIVSDSKIDDDLLKKAITDTGYTVEDIVSETVEEKKHGLFGIFKK